jgi:hypothetical protein
MLQKSTYGTTERWPEKMAGQLGLGGNEASFFLDFFVLLYQGKRTYKSDCINRTENKSAFADFAFEEEKDSPLLIEASPNPARHYVEFTYELSEIDQDGIIIITEINGKQIILNNTASQ